MSRRRKAIEQPLPLRIEESPHWPLGRARDERDRLAKWIADRVDEVASLRVDRVRYALNREQYASLFASLARDTAGISHLRSLWHLSAYCAALEAAAAPPPQNLSLAA